MRRVFKICILLVSKVKVYLEGTFTVTVVYSTTVKVVFNFLKRQKTS